MNKPLQADGDDLVGSTAIVTGASRGFGRAIATALSAAGAHVVGVARTQSQLDEVRDELGDTFTTVTADAADPATADRLHRRVPAAHTGAVRRGRPADEPAAGSDLGELQPELERGRRAGVSLDPLRAAAPAGAGQRGDRDVQRRRGQRVATERRLRRRQGHRQVHRQLRGHRIATGRAGDQTSSPFSRS